MSTIVDPSTSCPILLFDPPSCFPEEDSSPPLHSLITEAYREVTIYHKSVHFLSQLRHLRLNASQPLTPPSLVLVNIDKNNGADLNGLDLFQTIVRELGGADSLERDSSFILVAISNDCSPLVLCQCMALGAENVLLRPVRKEVVQTLWLNVVRRVTRASPPHRTSHARCQNNIVTKAPTPLDFITSNLSAINAKTDHISSLYLYDSAKKNYAVDHERVQQSSSVTLSCNLQFAHPIEQTPNQIRHLEKIITSWNFDPRRLDDELDVLRCVALMLENVAEECGGLAANGVGVNRDMLHNFILAVRASYHDCNPYHNFYHAVDVLQATYSYLRKMKVIGGNSTSENARIHQQTMKSILRPHEKFALCIAALCHDLGHPGVNNMFMVNCGSPLAEVYNDVAVLENYHAAALFALLRRDGVSFFGGSCRDETPQSSRYKDFRRIVTSAILATDMGRHFEYVKKIADQGSRFRFPSATTAIDIADCSSPTTPSLPSLDDNERTLFAAVLLKCGDISNAARPFPVAMAWSTALLDEFDMQRRVEMALSSEGEGEENSTNVLMANQPIGQIMFIDQFVGPLLDAVVGKPEEKFNTDFESVALTEWPDSPDDVPSSGLLELEFCRKMLCINRREWERRMVAASEDDVLICEEAKETNDACAGPQIDPIVKNAEDGILGDVTTEANPETQSAQDVYTAPATTMAPISVVGEPVALISYANRVPSSSTVRRSSLPSTPSCLRPVPKEVIHSSPGSPSFTKIPLTSPATRHPNHHTHSHHSHTIHQFYPQTVSNNSPASPATSRTAPMNAIVMGPFRNFRHNLTSSIGAGSVRYAYGTRVNNGCGFSPSMADKFGIHGFSKNGGGRRGSLPNYCSNTSMEATNAFATLKFLPTSVFVSPQNVFHVHDNAVEPSSEAVAGKPSKFFRSYNFPIAVPGPGAPQQRCEQDPMTHLSGDAKNTMPMPGELFLYPPNNTQFDWVRRRSIPPDWPL